MTRRRLYIETMEDILRRNPKIVVDDRLQGLVPLLNLGEGQRPAAGRPAAPAAAAAAPVLSQPRVGAAR